MTSTGVTAPGRARLAWRTLRRDRWWLLPGVTLVALTAFVVYTTWRAFSGRDYFSEPYISPFFSPCLTDTCPPGSGIGVTLPWPLSPALIILVIPGGLRVTCYYYRKAYYRSFWLSPPACAVAEPHRGYSGETRFPLVFQNAHRWFFYGALVFNVILTYDALLGFRDGAGDWGHLGLGTLILLANAVLLWLYSLSCHSCRHVVGGRLNSFGRHPLRYRFWTFVSRLNGRHATFAWLSLFSVALADLYVFLLARGTISDVRFF